MAAAELRSARIRGQVLGDPLTDRFALTLDDAYAVQRELTAARIAAGERIVGWKLGYTSAAMRAQMGIDQPNLGPLTDAMRLGSPGLLPAGALQPRAEPEIGLLLGRDLDPGGTVHEVLDACSAAFACLEVVDSVWAGYRFRIEDNTADGSSAAWFVVGDELALDDLPGVAVELSADGRTVDRASGAAAGGHPAAGVAWLAGEVQRRYGQPLAAGSLILTGGLTAAVPLAGLRLLRAEFAPAPTQRQPEAADPAAADPADPAAAAAPWAPVAAAELMIS